MGILDFLKPKNNTPTSTNNISNIRYNDSDSDNGNSGNNVSNSYENNCNPSGCNECGCDVFSTEFADEILYDNYSKGVSFLTLGDKVKLTYNGILAKSGAQDVYAVVGYGDNKNWQNTQVYPMNSTNQQIFELSLTAKEGEQINVAFKDKAENWDNNSGKNYSFYIH